MTTTATTNADPLAFDLSAPLKLPPDAPPLILSRLLKRYGRKLVLAGVDLEVPTGSVT